MAFLLGCEQVKLEFPTALIFESLTLGVNSGERIGVVGRNGDGKSSLLSLLSGRCEVDSGRVIKTGGVSVGVLEQRDHLNDDKSVKEVVIGEIPEYEWASNPKIREILSALLADIKMDAKIKTLSGGQRRRADLARVLIGDWDVLMLDEPTNHLDMPAIYWLANHLQKRWNPNDGALLVVTHDRWFLDEVCLSMWEVHDGIVTPFEGGYSAYIQMRLERDRQTQVAITKHNNALRRELAWLARGAKARSTKPKFRVDAAMELISDVPQLREGIKLHRSAITRLGKKVIHVRNASVSIDSKQIIKPLEFNIGASDRIAILGANGAGKSTLLHLLTGKLKPSSGRVEIGETVKFAILSQDLKELSGFEDDFVRELVTRNKTRYKLVDGREVTPSQLLQELGFSPDQLNCKVRNLSGGQRRRLQLMLILLDRPNVLILDEPGNDLDTDMLAQVESILDSWPSTLLLVSHDRYLVERVSDNQYALLDGELVHMPRGIDQYLEYVFKNNETKSDKNNLFSTNSSKQEQEQKSGISQKEIRDAKKKRSSVERKMSTIRSKIEQEKSELLKIDGTDYEALYAQQKKIDELISNLDELEMQWLELEEFLSSL